MEELAGSVEVRAMAVAREYYQQLGWEVTNVSRARGEHGGYDLLLKKGDERMNVEVKGSTRPYGIPDPYHTEFDPNTRRLIADVLCVVYFLPQTELPKLAIIPRDKIPPEYVVPRLGYRISGKFKNAKTLEKFFVDIDHMWGPRAPGGKTPV
jgi:hypothetical protein